MSIATYDLHLHTCWSYDALVEPPDYFRAADELGLRAIAVTEHHVIDSLDEVMAAARGYPRVRVIPAAELTMTTSIGAVDMVCLGFPRPLTPELLKIFEEYHQWQREAGTALVRGLQALGLNWTQEDQHELLESYRPARTIKLQGYTHIKNELQREEFRRRGFIADDEGYWPLLQRAWRATSATRPYPAPAEIVPVLHAAGVLVSIAHPSGYFQGASRERMDLLRTECMLDGIECASPKTAPELTPVYRQYCVEHGLVSTAGSDSHTIQDIQTKFARHGGQEEWLDEVLQRLRAFVP
ncbi:MAG: PHP domain-containing protein [Phycisphaerae bacterium]